MSEVLRDFPEVRGEREGGREGGERVGGRGVGPVVIIIYSPLVES